MEEKVARTQQERSAKTARSTRHAQEIGQDGGAFHGLGLSGLALLLIATPVALGSVALWARCFVFSVMIALLAIWFLREACSGRLNIARSWIWAPMALFFLLGAFQLLPLPWNVLSFLSPNTTATYDRLLPNATPASHTLSLFPYGTRMALLHAGSLAFMFFLAAHSVRRRRDAVVLVLALLAIGVFEALYGFGEQFSGSKHVFWQERRAHLAAVTGTFFNKNHFAGLLAMVLPLALGLLMALLPRERRAGTLRARLLHGASSSRMPQLVILPCAIIILATAICFSLSRAGIICSLISVVTFAICMGLTIGFRKYTLLLVLLMMAILLVAVGIGSELIVERIEDAASGHSASWGDRLDLSRSGWRMFKEFPLFGTGLGSFRHAFERFQSMRFRDRVADYLHNDWLQILCEMGVTGGIVVLTGLIILVAGTARKAFARKDAFCKWVALGALVGVGAMAIHSFFDYNLYKITSNGLIFAALLGLAFSVARMPSERSGSPERRDFFTLGLGPAPVRVLLSALVIVGGIFATIRPLRIAACDIAFNRYLAQSGRGEVDPYFFLSAGMFGGTLQGMDLIEQAQSSDPGNPKYDYYEAVFLQQEARDLVLEQARESAARLLDPQFVDIDTESFDRLAQAFAANLAKQPSPERTSRLRQCESALRRAIRGLPVSQRYHVALAQTLLQIEESSAGIKIAAETPIENPAPHARRAVWCAPGKPSVLDAAGRILLTHGLTHDPDGKGQDEVRDAIGYFRTAILADPSCAPPIYRVVRTTRLGNDILARVTPKTLGSYSYLCRTLWDEGDWEALLACLDVLDGLVARTEKRTIQSWLLLRPPGNTPSEESDLTIHSELSRESLAEDHVLRTKLHALQLRCQVLAILRREEERNEAVAAYRRGLREQVAVDLSEAQAWALRHRFNEAMNDLIAILEKDWSNPDALLTAAEVSHHSGALDGLPRWNRPIDLLYRLVIKNDRLPPEAVGRLQQIVAKVDASDAEDRLVGAFVTGAAKVLAGHTEAGVRQLEAIARGEIGGLSTWHQRHLVWQYIGDGYLAMGKPEQAAAAYAKAIAIVPKHGPSLERMAQLNPGNESRLKALRPSVPCNATFGGKLIFLGYDLTRESVPVNIHGSGLPLPDGMTVTEDMWFMTYYWQITDRVYAGYRPSVQFCDAEWSGLFRDDHELRTEDGPYPTDFAKSGEIIVEKRALRGDPTAARYLRIGIRSPAPPEPLSHNMPCDDGHSTFATRLVLGEAERAVVSTNASPGPTAEIERQPIVTMTVPPVQITADPAQPRR